MSLSLLIALLLPAGPAHTAAAAGKPVDDGNPACVRDGTTIEMNACAFQDLERETARMDRYLAAARLRAAEGDAESATYGEPTQRQAFLEKSQAAWLAYSTVVCDGVYDQWKDGTIRTVLYLGCRIDMTRQRTHLVWSDYLTFRDSTPPVLPEPVLSVAEEADAADAGTGTDS